MENKNINIEFITWLEQQRCYPFEQGWMLKQSFNGHMDIMFTGKEIIESSKQIYLTHFKEFKLKNILCMKI